MADRDGFVMRTKNKEREDVVLDDVATLGRLIREQRGMMNLTLRDVAESTGLSLAFVHAVEHGKRTAEIGKVLFLANALGIDLIG